MQQLHATMVMLFYYMVLGSLLLPSLGIKSKGTKHGKQFSTKYEPTWDSLDSRPLPAWYDEAKIGIFMHWGVYSVPSFGSEWFWWHWKGDKEQKYVDFMKKNYPPGFSYADFAPSFRAEFFDPSMWADLIAKSGARYFVLTSKHHEGWTNWKSSVSWNWNSIDNGPHRDLVGDLAEAVRQRTNVTFGLYFSLYEWFNPLYLKDKTNQFKTQQYVDDIMIPQLYDIVKTYKPEYIWSDGDWEASDTYWRSKEFIAWLYNESPVKDTVVTNDRWGVGCMCHHGGVFTCADRYNPGVLQKHKWENAMTVDKESWGYRQNTSVDDFLSMDNLTELLASTVSCGGNMLINVGPTPDGRIDPIFQERLLQLGHWLKVNGDAIYSSKPWRAQNDTLTSGIWYTAKTDAVYAIVLNWPSSGHLKLAEPITNEETTVQMLGLSSQFVWTPLSDKTGIIIKFPAIPESKLPCRWAWVLRLVNIK